MKFIVLILSVIVLTLTTVPCCAFEGGEGHAHKIGQKETQPCSERNDDCCKECSPFYVCGSCVGFTVSVEQLVAFVVPPTVLQHHQDPISFQLPLIPVSIWQPPKL